VTIIVVVVMVLHLLSSLLISALLPLAILIAFILMKIFAVQANIVALSGIAIAIGTMVDMGIVLSENILVHLDTAPADYGTDGNPILWWHAHCHADRVCCAGSVLWSRRVYGRQTENSK
jgi:Cu/Ag efflux pump CusA